MYLVETVIQFLWPFFYACFLEAGHGREVAFWAFWKFGVEDSNNNDHENYHNSLFIWLKIDTAYISVFVQQDEPFTQNHLLKNTS